MSAAGDHRVYLPATLDRLAAYQRDGAVPADVERFVAEDDSEDAEYAALTEAAAAAADLLGGAGRRVVLVAEVGDVDGAVPMERLVAVHVDTSEHPDPDDDLGWFATQEIPHLLDGSAW